jgi:type IV secretion system protein TrbE
MTKRYLWDEVPWLTMLPHEGRPRVVACSQFGWLMSMALSPADMSTAHPEQRLRNAARFAVALQTWIWIEERRVPLPGVATPTPDNRAARLFGVDRTAVHGEGAHYGSRHYVSVRHNPPSGLAVRLRNALLLPEPGETRGDYGPLFDDYVRSVDRMAGLLRFMGASVLEGDDLATYLRSTISVNDLPISVDPYEFLAPQLIDSPLHGGRPLWLGHEHNRLNVRAVQINTYPRRLEAGALDFGNDTFDGLSELGYRIRRVKRIRTQSKPESVRELEWLTRKAAMTQESMLLNVLRQFQKDASSPLNNKAASVTLEETDAMLLELQRGGVLRCQTTDNVLVYHENAQEAKAQAQKVEEFLLDHGFGVEINDMTTHDCVLGAIPGKTDVDFVRPGVNLLAAAVSAPLTRAWSGDLNATRSPILLHGRTSATSRFALSLHIDGANRHGFVCGGTGGGKSSLLNAMGLGHITAANGGRVMRVESGRSGYVVATLVGGVTFNIGEQGCGVQPYRQIDKPTDRAWAHSWTLARIRSQLGAAADGSDISQAVDSALRIMAQMSPDDRTMTTFCLNVPSEEAARAMRLYTHDGPLGYIFDAVDDRSYDADWINFELSAITDDDEAMAAPALISYLWRHIMRLSSARRPLMLQLDEASAYVSGGFVKGLGWGLRTYRKLKTQVVFATQSVLDLSKSDISHIILNSCPTQIYVQDSAVTTAEGLRVLNELRLSQHDADVIAGMDQAGSYFVHRPGVGKAVVSFDLGSPISSAMVLMTDDQHYQLARRVERRGGDFLTEWMAEHFIPVGQILGEEPEPLLRAAE